MKTTQKCTAFQEFLEYEIVSSRKTCYWISNRIFCSVSVSFDGTFVVDRFLKCWKKILDRSKKSLPCNSWKPWNTGRTNVKKVYIF